MLSPCNSTSSSSSLSLNCSDNDHHLSATVNQMFKFLEEVAKSEREGKLNAVAKVHFQTKFNQHMKIMKNSFDLMDGFIKHNADVCKTSVAEAKDSFVGAEAYAKEASRQKKRLLNNFGVLKSGPSKAQQILAQGFLTLDSESMDRKNNAESSLRAVSCNLKATRLDMALLKHHLARLSLLIEITRLKLLPIVSVKQMAEIAAKVELYEAEKAALIQKTTEFSKSVLPKQHFNE